MGRSKKTARPSQIPTIPHDVLVEYILARLPIKTLIRFKAVCKYWYSTILSSDLAKAHLKLGEKNDRFYFLIHDSDYKFLLLPYDEHSNLKSLVRLKNVFTKMQGEVKVVGCCNGLVCLFLGDEGYGNFVLWNPATQETNKIANCHVRAQALCWSFGYVSSIDDYKIATWFNAGRGSSPRFYVFSLRCNEWRRVDEMKLRRPGGDDNRIWLTMDPVYVDGNVYYQHGDVLSGRMNCAIRFDLETERVTEIPWLDGHIGQGTLFAMNSCLMLDWFFGGKYVLRKHGDIYTWENQLLPNGIGLRGFSETGKCLGLKEGGFTLTDVTAVDARESGYLDRLGIDVYNYSASLVSPYGRTLSRMNDKIIFRDYIWENGRFMYISRFHQ